MAKIVLRTTLLWKSQKEEDVFYIPHIQAIDYAQ